MKYSVEYSKAAVRDLDRVWSEVFSDRVWSEVFRASRSYDITERYLNDLMDKVESKSEYPLSGAPLYYEDRFTGYYYVVFKEYLAFYRLESKRILVDRVLFGRSDYIRILQLGTDQ